MICSITEHYNRAKRPTQLVYHLGLLSSSILNTDKPGTDGTALCICFPLLKTGIAALVSFSRTGALPSAVCWLSFASTERRAFLGAGARGRWAEGHMSYLICQVITWQWHRSSTVTWWYVVTGACVFSCPDLSYGQPRDDSSALCKL